MSRRSSHANISGTRRQSVASDGRSKRYSLKDGSAGGPGAGRLGTISDVKDGDTIYKTERLYPSIPDHPEDVTVSVARWQRDTRSGSTMSLSRDETATPSDNSPAHERDRYFKYILLISDRCDYQHMVSSGELQIGTGIYMNT